MAHVYHWKHGWIPLDHTAALKKAKGNHHAAKKYLEAAHSKDGGINSKEHVVRAAKSVRSVDPKDRGGAVRQVQSAAAKHGVDLPGSKKPATPAKKAAATPAPGKPASAGYSVVDGSSGSRVVKGPGGKTVGRVDRVSEGDYVATLFDGSKSRHQSSSVAEKFVADHHKASLPQKGDVPVRDQKTRAPQTLGPGMTVGFDRDGNVKQVPLSKREREAAAQAPAVDSMANYQKSVSDIGAALPSGPTAANPAQIRAYRSASSDVTEQYHRTVINPSSTPAQKAAAKSIAKRKIKDLRKRYSIDEQSSSWISK